MRWCLALTLSLFAPAALACGPDSDCVVADDRTYRIHVGESLGEAPGALVFSHGYRGSAAGAMRNMSLRGLADQLGVALIALQGVDGMWGLANAPSGRVIEESDEMAYVATVLDDAAERFGLDRDRIVATGFSAGGMMTWTLACRRGDLFAGFLPVSGTFWDPVPESCPGPVRSLVHIHGDEDPVVPLMGRPIGRTKQGEVPAALAMYRTAGAFNGAETETVGDMACAMEKNAAGQTLGFCEFPGGHSFSVARLRQGWDMIMP